MHQTKAVGGGGDASGIQDSSGAAMRKVNILAAHLDGMAARPALHGRILATAAALNFVVDWVWRPFFALKRTIWSVGE